MKLKVLLVFLFIFFASFTFAEAQVCKINSIATEAVIKETESIAIYNSILKIRSLKGKFPLPYKIPAIVEVYSISDASLEFDVNINVSDKNLVKKIFTNEKFEFCVQDLPEGSYLLRLGASRGIRSVTYQRITITDKGSKKPIIIR